MALANMLAHSSGCGTSRVVGNNLRRLGRGSAPGPNPAEPAVRRDRSWASTSASSLGDSLLPCRRGCRRGSPRQTRAPAARTPPRDDVSGQGTAGSAAMAVGWRGFSGGLLVQAAPLGGVPGFLVYRNAGLPPPLFGMGGFSASSVTRAGKAAAFFAVQDAVPVSLRSLSKQK